MKDNFNNMGRRLFIFVLLIFSILTIFQAEASYAAENVNSVILKKVSQSYTNKFCNSIGFGLSKESAMKFSLQENNQVFNKRKGFKNIDKEILAEEIALEVVEKCGYPINLSGEKGILEFKNYYLTKDRQSSGIMN